MEFNSLYLKYFFLVQSFCFSLGLIEGGRKFTRKNQPVTFECLVEKQDFKNWQIDGTIINGNANASNWKANVPPSNVTIINITPLSDFDVTVVCVITNDKIRFYATPLFNDIGNLYTSSETPNAIRDKKFTLECKTDGDVTSRTWYTGNGTVIAKYSGKVNQNYSKYFGSRQETSCQNKSCTLSITNVSLAEDNMSIICSGDTHTSMFNITVFVLPKSVTIKATSDTDPVENKNKSYECLIKDTNPEFSVYWSITKKDGKPKYVTKYISNKPSKSGNLTTLSSNLTLTLKKNFQKLQCIAYFPGKNEFVNHSKELDLHIKYSPERHDMTLNVSGGKVCANIPTKFHCSWKGGDPSADVILMYKDISNTSKEEVELNVIPSKSHQTVKCLGIHIAANVSREKNLTIHYPPDLVNIEADEPFLEGTKGILHCKAENGYPKKYNYRWHPNNDTSQDLTFPNISRIQNNKVFTCYASNMCNKKELHKIHWINVEYPPDITASENVTLFENQASIINCSAKGNPTPKVRFEDENRRFLSNSALTFNRTNVSKVFCAAIAKSKKHGNLTSRKEINILLKYAPRVNLHISNETNNIIINCTAFDGNPNIYEYKLKQKWRNATKNTYNMNVLSINNPSFNNTGTWVCHVSNEDFHVNKSSNYKIPVKPIYSPVPNGPKKRNVSNGETVIFKQCFYSHPKSDVKWQKNEELIDSNKYSTTDDLSNEFPFKGSCTSLKIEDIEEDDIGTYTLTVENSMGKSTTAFTLRYKEKQEINKGIIIGCTVGIVLLIIIMGLLAYKFYKRRAIKNNNEFSSTKAINTINGRDLEHCNAEDVHEVSNAIYDSSGHFDDLNTDDIYANVKKPNKLNNVEDLYAKVNKPSMQTNDNTNRKKPADVNDLYAKVNKPNKETYDNTSRKKPADVEELYAKVNKPSVKTHDNTNRKKPADNTSRKKPADNTNKKKPADVEELYAKVNKPSVKTHDVNDPNAKVKKPSKKPEDVDDFYANVNTPSMKPDEDGSMNDNYESNNQSNEPESVQECNYAELEFRNDPGPSKPVPKPKEEETIYADLILDC